MYEVTKDNFSVLLPRIQRTINNADFLSIDTEFTGLYLDGNTKPSLFDSSAERYQKLKRSVEAFIVAQVGITAFVGDTKDNRYHATSFSFYLCPIAFGSCDPRFSCQTSGIQFLSSHDFDFNKCLKTGVPYLNRHQERQIVEDLKGGYFIANCDLFGSERRIQRSCSRVASWLCQSKPGDFLTLPLKELDPVVSFVTQNEIRQRFSNTWTSLNDFGQIVVENVSEERKLYLTNVSTDWEQTQHQHLINELLGFSRVFKLLVEAKKPLVGHNLLMDLLFIFSKFHDHLPDTYEEFKKEIHTLFPVIFDTKHLHHYLKEKFMPLKLKSAYNLEVLDRILRSQTTFRLTRMQPAIQESCSNFMGDVENTPVNKPHHAGYDSYLCGCVFIRMFHLEHFTDNSAVESSTNSISFKSYFSTIEKHKNCVNVIRAATTFTKLDGDDPSCKRPPLLHVSYTGPKGRITSQQLAVEFSFYGTVDIQMLSSTQAIVATSHFIEARDILYAFKTHNTIHVTRFRFLLHSRVGRFLWWSTLGVASGSCLLLLFKIFKN